MKTVLMNKIKCLFCYGLVFAFSVVLTGCAGGSTDNSAQAEHNDTFDELKDDAKSAWHVASFAMNVANPFYYAQKGATYGYKKYIKKDDEETE